jgi:hypothetical protein
MTIQAFEWYKVKDTPQICQVTGIASTADPDVHVRAANENLKGFHVYLLWFTPTDDAHTSWTKRAILMEIRKALTLLREPTAEDAPLIEMLKTIGRNLPLVSMGVDGEKTVPLSDDSL